MTVLGTRRSRLLDGLLGLVAADGLVLGPFAAMFALLMSPCGPDSSADVCVLAAPHAVAVQLPLIGGPVVAVLTLVAAFVLRRHRRRILLAGAVVVVLLVVVPFVIIALAPDTYPSAYEPRD